MSSDEFVALIVGTSSNLGLNIAYRLLESLPKEQKLTLIVTSRTLPKVKECIASIKEYNETQVDRSGILQFDYILLDLTNMVSIVSAYYDLNKKYQKIDLLYMCSGQGVYGGIDWIQAVKEICVNPIEGTTQPTYKIQKIGVKSADGLGLVFQANIFGPYYLVHKIEHLLVGGKIIWVSSLMSKPSYFSFNDFQLIESNQSYEGSKRLMDLLHLGTYERLNKKNITQYLTHPGIFESLSFHKYLNFITLYGMLFLFYLVRFLGSPWHNITGYNGAETTIYVTINDDLDQKLKYGSGTDKRGNRLVITEEVDLTGKEDVVLYFDKLVEEWDELLKNQIVDTRKP